jgi:hypothetical protein
MAWAEQTERGSWRVRYPKADGAIGSVSGFASREAAQQYARDLQTGRRQAGWPHLVSGRVTVDQWAAVWVQTLDVEIRAEEKYLSYLRNHIQPRWGTTTLSHISPLAVTAWRKSLRQRYAAKTVDGIVLVLSMMLDDAVDERLIPANPVHRRRRRGRRRDHQPSPVERVWATPAQVLAIAEQASLLGGPGPGC